MASKKLPSSSGYFNKKMLDILEQGERTSKKQTTSKSAGKTTKRK